MICGQNFEHVIFFEMSPEKILCKFYFFVTQKSTKGASNGVPEWLPLSVTEILSRRQRTFTGNSSTVAENSESCLTCLRSVATYGVHQSWGRPAWAPIFCKGTHPSIPPNDYVATCHKVLKCITNFTWSTIQRLSTVATVLLMNSGLVSLLTFEIRYLSAVLTMAA